MQVAFYLHDARPLEELARLDPDVDWREFVTGERAWILQAYLRLRSRGLPVELSDRVPDDGLVVFSSKQRVQLRRQCARTRALLIGVREDVGEALIADLEIVQNNSQADQGRRHFVPFWPQPNLQPRDAARGTQIRTLAFKGFLGNLHPGFRDKAWTRALAERGLQWIPDAAPYKRNAVEAGALEWNDYRSVDLIVAVRVPDARLHARKPATKLYNAWHAGVPALLGPELAYRELRKTDLDFIEIENPQQAIAAIDRLLHEPRLYSAMVANGRVRAPQFSAQSLATRWEHLLFEIAPQHLEKADFNHWRGRSLLLKELTRRLQRKLGVWR